MSKKTLQKIQICTVVHDLIELSGSRLTRWIRYQPGVGYQSEGQPFTESNLSQSRFHQSRMRASKTANKLMVNGDCEGLHAAETAPCPVEDPVEH